MKKIMFACASLAVVAAGCQTAPGPALQKLARTPSFTCDAGKPCEVTVTVTECSASGVRVRPEDIGLRQRNTNVPITWSLKTTLPDLVFAENGVYFKPTSGQFRDAVRIANGKQYKWVGLNTTPGVYPYGIRILRTNGTLCADVDPSVINDVPDGYQ